MPELAQPQTVVKDKAPKQRLVEAMRTRFGKIWARLGGLSVKQEVKPPQGATYVAGSYWTREATEARGDVIGSEWGYEGAPAPVMVDGIIRSPGALRHEQRQEDDAAWADPNTVAEALPPARAAKVQQFGRVTLAQLVSLGQEQAGPFSPAVLGVPSLEQHQPLVSTPQPQRPASGAAFSPLPVGPAVLGRS